MNSYPVSSDLLDIGFACHLDKFVIGCKFDKTFFLSIMKIKSRLSVVFEKSELPTLQITN